MFMNSLLFSPLRFVFNLFCLNGIEGSEDQIIGLWHSSQTFLQAHPSSCFAFEFFFFFSKKSKILMIDYMQRLKIPLSCSCTWGGDLGFCSLLFILCGTWWSLWSWARLQFFPLHFGKYFSARRITRTRLVPKQSLDILQIELECQFSCFKTLILI